MPRLSKSLGAIEKKCLKRLLREGDKRMGMKSYRTVVTSRKDSRFKAQDKKNL